MERSYITNQECFVKTVNHPTFAIFESLLWTPDEEYFLLEKHLDRMSIAADYFDYPFLRERTVHSLSKFVETLSAEAHKVRLLLDHDGHIDCQATPLAKLHKPDPACVRLALSPIDSKDMFLYHKTTYRQIYENATAECLHCDEILLWNEHGELTEAGTANLVLDIKGQFLTPPISSGLLAGTFRAYLLERREIHEQTLPVSALSSCQNIYLINSVRKWRKAVLLNK